MRVEAKYHLDALRAALLQDELRATGFELDPGCREGRPYTVSTIYLDNPQLDAYEDKLASLGRRTKYRLRFYGEEPGETLRLEHKEKDSHLSWKRVEWVRWQEVLAFRRDLAGALLEKLDPRAGYVEPVLCVQYERMAFEHRGYRARINFDSHLRWRDVDPERPTLLSDSVVEALEPGQVVCEIKVPRDHAGQVTDLVRRWDLHWRATSKYAICVAHRQRCLSE